MPEREYTVGELPHFGIGAWPGELVTAETLMPPATSPKGRSLGLMLGVPAASMGLASPFMP